MGPHRSTSITRAPVAVGDVSDRACHGAMPALKRPEFNLAEQAEVISLGGCWTAAS